MDISVSDNRRRSGVRRDLNDIVRDESGKISWSKIGTIAGQGIAGWILVKYAEDLIDHPDTLAIMFTVLIAPEIWRKFLAMKYGQATDPDPAPSATVTTRTTVTP